MIGNDLKDANIRQNNVKGNYHMCMCVVFCWDFFFGGGGRWLGKIWFMGVLINLVSQIYEIYYLKSHNVKHLFINYTIATSLRSYFIIGLASYSRRRPLLDTMVSLVWIFILFTHPSAQITLESFTENKGCDLDQVIP